MDPADALPIRSPLKLLISIFITGLAGYVGSAFTAMDPGSWYAGLSKPWFTPPGWLSGLIWTILYILMGISLYLIWMEATGGRAVGEAPAVFLVQLALNVLWPYAFFGLRSPLLGLVAGIIFWVSIAATIAVFFRINRTSAVLLVPYFLWVTFAACLVVRIFQMNP
jgi:tryptophan-rich sensory protein